MRARRARALVERGERAGEVLAQSRIAERDSSSLRSSLRASAWLIQASAATYSAVLAADDRVAQYAGDAQQAQSQRADGDPRAGQELEVLRDPAVEHQPLVGIVVDRPA